MSNRKIVGVDIGNTSVKAAEFTQDAVGEVLRFDTALAVRQHFGEALYVVCSVADQDLAEKFGDCLVVNNQTPLPLAVDYATPHTLGADRLAGAVGAWQLFPGKNLLVIDAGTCITYDIVTADGTFRGGIISPGLEMRYRAMHAFTKGLPLLSVDAKFDRPDLVGKSTEECMRIGARHGLQFEFEAFLKSFNKKYDQLQIVMTGGLAEGFESTVDLPIFASSKIVLAGLHAIWKLNEDT